MKRWVAGAVGIVALSAAAAFTLQHISRPEQYQLITHVEKNRRGDGERVKSIKLVPAEKRERAWPEDYAYYGSRGRGYKNGTLVEECSKGYRHTFADESQLVAHHIPFDCMEPGALDELVIDFTSYDNPHIRNLNPVHIELDDNVLQEYKLDWQDSYSRCVTDRRCR